MRCKKHYTDLSSTIGVCATCLREKLLPLLAVQSPPLIFPRSVSPPRVTISTADPPNRLFYSTPQLGPNPFPTEKQNHSTKKISLSLLPKFLRSGSATSSSWISALFPRRRKNIPVPAEDCGRRAFSGRGRGMSPARVSDCGGDGEFDGGGSSGYETTPRRAGGAPAGRRSGNVAAFCLSPLVRPSPNRRRDAAAAAAESPAKPHLAAAAGFCANRSRKMADFGRRNR